MQGADAVVANRLRSPLRYPGGKAALGPYLAEIIDLNELNGCQYYEPFAGGAGAALNLLVNGKVSEIHLNDADPRIYAFWRSVLFQNERLCEAVSRAVLSISQWKRQQRICKSPSKFGSFETAYATLYMNRCNRSGIVLGAGPIGGFSQQGEYKLDARFNRKGLVQRLLDLHRYRDRIHVYKMDARKFLKKIVPKGKKRASVFVYLDPPYYHNGNRLYLNSFDHENHRKLSAYMLEQTKMRWVMSYDNAKPIRSFYRDCVQSYKKIRYSLNSRCTMRELLIFPKHLLRP